MQTYTKRRYSLLFLLYHFLPISISNSLVRLRKERKKKQYSNNEALNSWNLIGHEVKRMSRKMILKKITFLKIFPKIIGEKKFRKFNKKKNQNKI